MAKITKRNIDKLIAAQPIADTVVWDDEVRGFGVRLKPSGTVSYLVQYRNEDGRSRRLTLGRHGVLAPEQARKDARATLGLVARGGDPAEERQTRRKAMSVGELCDIYLSAAEKGLIRGKRRRPKKASTIATDRGRIERHIKPLLGSRKVRDLAQHDINKFIRDVASGKTATVVKTKPRGRARVTGGRGTASRTVGLLGGILSYAVSEGVIETNPARGAERFEDNRRAVRLTPSQYRDLGRALVSAESEGQNKSSIEIAWLICLSGCRRGEAVGLQVAEIDKRQNVLNLIDSKEGTSIRPIGTAPLDRLKKLDIEGEYMFPATDSKKPYGGFPKAWQRLVRRAEMPEITPHVLRHSFASEAHDLGFSEPTIAALLGHHSGSTTRGYIHHVDSALIMAADSISRHILGMMLGRSSVTKRHPRVTGKDRT